VTVDSLEGTRLKHFEVVRLLGRGGMARCTTATTPRWNARWPSRSGARTGHDPEVVERFEREARAQARLRHPNVAQIYFIGEDRGVHFS